MRRGVGGAGCARACALCCGDAGEAKGVVGVVV